MQRVRCEYSIAWRALFSSARFLLRNICLSTPIFFTIALRIYFFRACFIFDFFIQCCVNRLLMRFKCSSTIVAVCFLVVFHKMLFKICEYLLCITHNQDGLWSLEMLPSYDKNTARIEYGLQATYTAHFPMHRGCWSTVRYPRGRAKEKYF